MQLSPTAKIDTELQDMLEAGTRWQQGGLDPRTGCGCYGLIWYVYRLVGIDLPDTAEGGEALFHPVAAPYQPFDVAQAELGSIFTRPHVGILLTPQTGFHIAESTNGLARFSLQSPFWRRGLRRVWRYRSCVCV